MSSKISRFFGGGREYSELESANDKVEVPLVPETGASVPAVREVLNAPGIGEANPRIERAEKGIEAFGMLKDSLFQEKGLPAKRFNENGLELIMYDHGNSGVRGVVSNGKEILSKRMATTVDELYRLVNDFEAGQ